LSKLDRRSTILLQAARQNTEAADEKQASGFEDPGMDTLRGSFGAVGSIIRANTARRMSKSSRGTSSLHIRPSTGTKPYDIEADAPTNLGEHLGMTRHQLYDAPVPRDPMERVPSFASSDRRPTIKFGAQDVVHQYRPTGKGDTVTHEHRNASHGYPYPPTPNSAGLDSPRGADISETNLVDVDAVQHTVIMSPRTTTDIRTAPPTIKLSLFDEPEKDALENAGASLSTLPSATDSTESGTSPWDEEEAKRAKAHRHRYGRSYPRGDDDKDESVSLWLGDGALLDDEDTSRNPGGIRLVKPSSDTRF